MNEYTKHPDATQDIRCTWPDLQHGERIMQSRWSAMGLTVVAQQIVADDSVTIGWIAGGFGLTRYTVMNSVLTNLGNLYSQTMVLHVADNVPVAESGL